MSHTETQATLVPSSGTALKAAYEFTSFNPTVEETTIIMSSVFQVEELRHVVMKIMQKVYGRSRI